MKKEVKDTIVVELGQKLKEYSHFYLVDVTGMNAGATSKLRQRAGSTSQIQHQTIVDPIFL